MAFFGSARGKHHLSAHLVIVGASFPLSNSTPFISTLKINFCALPYWVSNEHKIPFFGGVWVAWVHLLTCICGRSFTPTAEVGGVSLCVRVRACVLGLVLIQHIRLFSFFLRGKQTSLPLPSIVIRFLGFSGIIGPRFKGKQIFKSVSPLYP